ncbi:hypothetical protein HNY73_011007 [Argiope bruennichi]|uniref:Uncharacterized protein n=1 Tax=Argiope bruennichi TaxID=94029 RepID=A0A8T0F3R0_ARGBR|nr:hypothetical protein HNY73_011007 [Argiope bruennichi]
MINIFATKDQAGIFEHFREFGKPCGVLRNSSAQFCDRPVYAEVTTRIEESFEELKAIIKVGISSEKMATNAEANAEERVASPDVTSEAIITNLDKQTKEFINQRISQSYVNIPFVSIEGDIPRHSARPEIYAVALPEHLLLKYGVLLYYDQALALEAIRRYRMGRYRIFTNLFDAVEYAIKPVEPKKKGENKPKKAKGTKTRSIRITSGYFLSWHFRLNLGTIYEDPQDWEAKDKVLHCNENEENGSHTVSRAQDLPTEETAGSPKDFQNNEESDSSKQVPAPKLNEPNNLGNDSTPEKENA